MTRIAHDLRGPLNVFRLDVEALRERGDLDHDGEVRDALARMHHAAAGMARLLEDALAYTRLREGGIELSLQPLDLLALVRQVVDARSGGRARVELEVASPNDALPVTGDSRRLSLAVGRLLDLALARARSGEAVCVTVEEDGPELRVLVRSGVNGFPPELRDVMPPAPPDAFAVQRTAGPGLHVARACLEAQGGRFLTRVDGDGRAEYGLALPR